MGLTVSLIKLAVNNITLYGKPFSFASDQVGSFQATVTESDLAAFLESRAPVGLKKFKIRAADGKLYIDAVKTMIIEVPAKAVCTLRIQGGTQMFVDIESVEISGVGAKNLVQSQLDQINPVLDVTEFPIKANLQTVESANGVLILKGTATP
jgi:hypothetical protein